MAFPSSVINTMQNIRVLRVEYLLRKNEGEKRKKNGIEKLL